MGFFKNLFGKKEEPKKENNAPKPAAAAPRAPQAAPARPDANMNIFRFDRIPSSLEELKQLPEADLRSPFKTAALTMLALCAYANNKDVGIEMLNFLRGPRPMSPAEIQFIRDRFMDNGKYIPFSYFKGANPNNGYTPSMPYTLEIKDNPYSYQEENYATLHLTSGGADSPRQIKLRKKGSGEWFLWEQFVMVGIRPAKADDPWA